MNDWEDKVIGFGVINTRTCYEKTYNLDSLIVSSKYRNYGLGNCLLDFIENDIRNRIKYFITFCLKNNRALKFYQRKEFKTLYDIWFLDNSKFHEIKTRINSKFRELNSNEFQEEPKIFGENFKIYEYENLRVIHEQRRTRMLYLESLNGKKITSNQIQVITTWLIRQNRKFNIPYLVLHVKPNQYDENIMKTNEYESFDFMLWKKVK